MLKVSAFYLEKQYQNKKALFTDPIFSEGFAAMMKSYKLELDIWHKILIRFMKDESAVKLGDK